MYWILVLTLTLEGFADAVSHSYCKLLTAIGDHSTQYLATNLSSSAVSTPVLAVPVSGPLPTKGHLAQTFLRHLLAYTALPGYYGVDEEESEMTLGFWYLFQETLWGGDLEYDSDSSVPPANKREGEQMNVTKAVYSELVKVLQQKVTWPEKSVLQSWSRGMFSQVDFLCDKPLTRVKIRGTSSNRTLETSSSPLLPD